MTIQINTRGPAPKGADLIGLKEAFASLTETHGLTVDRIDICEDVEQKMPEHYEVAKILADNFTPEEYDDSDFEWCAFQLVQAGYRKQSDVIKEVFAKVDETLKRYSHLHKYAEEARQSKEEYADGTPMEMVSVWEVLSLKKWEAADYENMNELQDNIETIAKARLLAEIEKDFRLLAKEMGCGE